MTTDRLTPEQKAAPSAATFLDAGGWGYGVGVVESCAGRRYGWAGGLGTLWYSWPDHQLSAVLITQVLPPSTDMLNAFTTAVETSLTG
jgi:CubicO group peptidase (beta-lactamase class C family)